MEAWLQLITDEWILRHLEGWTKTEIGRLAVVMGWDCHLSTAALGLLYYPRMIAMWASE
jgi:hypothetical protein